LKNILLEMASKANPSSKEFYDADWKYNCAAWTGEELENFAQLIIEECVGIVLAGSIEDESSRRRTAAKRLLEVAEQISNHFNSND